MPQRNQRKKRCIKKEMTPVSEKEVKSESSSVIGEKAAAARIQNIATKWLRGFHKALRDQGYDSDHDNDRQRDNWCAPISKPVRDIVLKTLISEYTIEEFKGCQYQYVPCHCTENDDSCKQFIWWKITKILVVPSLDEVLYDQIQRKLLTVDSIEIVEPNDEEVRTALLFKLTQFGFTIKIVGTKCDHKCFEDISCQLRHKNDSCIHKCEFTDYNCSRQLLSISNDSSEMVSKAVDNEIEFIDRIMTDPRRTRDHMMGFPQKRGVKEALVRKLTYELGYVVKEEILKCPLLCVKHKMYDCNDGCTHEFENKPFLYISEYA